MAHARGFVHRDVRPGNVLWDEDGGRALLTDFGIAAVLAGSGEDATRLTRTGQILGDPRYLSPEQLLDQQITGLTDIYLLGVLGYELLSGQGPYAARTNVEWISAHLNREPRDVRELRTDVDRQPQICFVAVWPGSRSTVPAPPTWCACSEAERRPPGRTSGGRADDLAELVKRRVPQILLVSAGAGVTLIGLADALEDLLPTGSKLLTVIFVVAGVLAAAVVGWFHGERGRQRAPVMEYVLLTAIGVAWLAVSAWAVMAR